MSGQPLVQTVTVVIPAAGCGLIIGKGGERINQLREQTQAKIMLQSKDKAIQGLNERTVAVTGTMLNCQMVSTSFQLKCTALNWLLPRVSVFDW